MAGVVEAVGRVTAAGIEVCVASQSKPTKIGLSLALTGLSQFFPETARFSSYSVAHGKPAPDVFLHAAASMGAEPAGCVVVEDTVSGVTAAVSAGMRALGYAADSDEGALHDAGAPEILRSMDDLAGMLGLE